MSSVKAMGEKVHFMLTFFLLQIGGHRGESRGWGVFCEATCVLLFTYSVSDRKLMSSCIGLHSRSVSFCQKVVLCALVFRNSPLEPKLCLFCSQIDVTCLQCYKHQLAFYSQRMQLKWKICLLFNLQVGDNINRLKQDCWVPWLSFFLQFQVSVEWPGGW